MQSIPMNLAPLEPLARPNIKGRLFTARDSLMDSFDKVPPAYQLSFDAMPLKDQNQYLNNPFFMEKQSAHLELRKALQKAKQGNRVPDKKLFETLEGLATYIPRAPDAKKWQCGRVGCSYKGTKQHILAHLRKKDHVGEPMFFCRKPRCKHAFFQPQDCKRHEERFHPELFGKQPVPQSNNSRIRPRTAQRVARTQPVSGTNHPQLDYHDPSAIHIAEDENTPSYEGSTFCDTSSEGSDSQDQHFEFQPLAQNPQDNRLRQYGVPIPNTDPAAISFFPASGALPTTQVEYTHLPQTRPTTTKTIDSSDQFHGFPDGRFLAHDAQNPYNSQIDFHSMLQSTTPTDGNTGYVGQRLMVPPVHAFNGQQHGTTIVNHTGNVYHMPSPMPSAPVMQPMVYYPLTPPGLYAPPAQQPPSYAPVHQDASWDEYIFYTDLQSLGTGGFGTLIKKRPFSWLFGGWLDAMLDTDARPRAIQSVQSDAKRCRSNKTGPQGIKKCHCLQNTVLPILAFLGCWEREGEHHDC